MQRDGLYHKIRGYSQETWQQMVRQRKDATFREDTNQQAQWQVRWAVRQKQQ